MIAKVWFITGTDTGAGKTFLTASLLASLRRQGHRALALKPFCSGPRDDAELLFELQEREIPLDQVNPFWFSEPLAPAVAARQAGRSVPLPDVLRHIAEIRTRCETLLIEGAGGLFVPLGPGYTVADLISALNPSVLIAAQNKLGVLNHATLTVRALQQLGIRDLKLVLISPENPDLASDTNPPTLAELLAAVPVILLPHIGKSATSRAKILQHLPQLQPMLREILS